MAQVKLRLNQFFYIFSKKVLYKLFEIPITANYFFQSAHQGLLQYALLICMFTCIIYLCEPLCDG